MLNNNLEILYVAPGFRDIIFHNVYQSHQKRKKKKTKWYRREHSSCMVQQFKVRKWQSEGCIHILNCCQDALPFWRLPIPNLLIRPSFHLGLSLMMLHFVLDLFFSTEVVSKAPNQDLVPPCNILHSFISTGLWHYFTLGDVPVVIAYYFLDKECNAVVVVIICLFVCFP